MADIADRYLGIDPDEPVSIQLGLDTLKWLRQVFLKTAKRGRRLPNPRLIFLSPEKLTYTVSASASPPPSLEEFIEEYGYEDFSQAEQLEAWEVRYGENQEVQRDRSSIRNERLRKKQLEAIKFYEDVFDDVPSIDDCLGAWIDAKLADRLSREGFDTLRQVIDMINLKGFTWYKSFPRIGIHAAQQIAGWLNSEPVQGHIQYPVSIRSRNNRKQRQRISIKELRARQFGVVPLELLQIPEELNGQSGLFRSPENFEKHANDLAMMTAWLNTKSGSTQKIYQLEVERLVLFAVLELRKSFSSLTAEDLNLFQIFLRSLGEVDEHDKLVPWPFKTSREMWKSDRPYARTDERWKPFAGPLNLVSQKRSIVIVKALYSFAIACGYLRYNPSTVLKNKKRSEYSSAKNERVFSRDEIKYLIQFLESEYKSQVNNPTYERTRFVFLFFYFTGLRISELVNARICDIVPASSKGNLTGDFVLKVIGKGKKFGEFVLSSSAIQCLNRYLRSLGQLPIGANESKDYILSPLNSKGVGKERTSNSTRNIHDVIKSFFQAARKPLRSELINLRMQLGSEEALNSDIPLKMTFIRNMDEHLEQASAHWLRHSFGTHWIAEGASLSDVQRKLRHASADTTVGYVHNDLEVEIQLTRKMSEIHDKLLNTPLLPSPIITTASVLPLPVTETAEMDRAHYQGFYAAISLMLRAENRVTDTIRSLFNDGKNIDFASENDRALFVEFGLIRH